VLQQRPDWSKRSICWSKNFSTRGDSVSVGAPTCRCRQGDRDLLGDGIGLRAPLGRLNQIGALGGPRPEADPYTLNLSSLREKLSEFESLKHVRLDRIMHFWMGLGIAA